MDKNTLGYRIRYYRKRANMKQVELAKLIEIKTAAHISKIENGKIYPKIGTLIKISKALNVSLNDLAVDYLAKNNIAFSEMSDNEYQFLEELSVSSDDIIVTLNNLLEEYISMKDKFKQK